MNSFDINKSAKIDLKVKSEDINIYSDWYFFNFEHMIVIPVVENTPQTGMCNKYSPLPQQPIKFSKDGVETFMVSTLGWKIMEESVQIAYSDYIAEREILGEP